MQRSLVIALVLLLAAAAAGLWAMQGSTTAAPNAPESQQDVIAAEADPELGPTPSVVGHTSEPSERAVASTADATLTKITKAVLRVHAFYVSPEHKDSPLGNEQPAAGVLVTLHRASSGYANAVHERVVTDEAGLATFASVPPGKWGVRSDRGDRNTIDVETGEVDVAFQLEYGVSVAGLVVNSKQQPIDNASVWLQSASPDWHGGSILTTTGPDGRFSLEHIPPHVSLGAFARNYTRSPLIDLDIVTTTTSPANVTLQLRDKGGQLTGTVINQDGKPVANALIGIGKQDGRMNVRGDRIIERWSVRSTETDQDGRFLMVGLLPGTSSIAIRAKGYGYWRSECKIVDQQDQDITIEVERSGTIFGIATNGENTPIAGAIIRSYDLAPATPFIAGGQIDFDETFGYIATTADKHGAYTLRDVTAGTAHLFVQDGKRRSNMGEPVPHAHETIEMPPGGTVEWNPVISNGRTITGVVYYQDGHPMPNVFITLIDQQSGQKHILTNNDEGVFLFVNLEDVTYDVHVQVWDAPKDSLPIEKSGIVPDQGRTELRATWDKPVKQAQGIVTGRVDDIGLRIKNAENAYVSIHSEGGWFRTGDKLVDGTFKFDKVTPCRFLLVLKEGDTVLGTSAWHELLPGAQLDTGILQTKPGGSVQIRVTREPGTEACEPKLFFRREGAANSTVVSLGIGNEKLVSSLTPGTYRVTGFYKGMANINGSMTIAEGNTTNLSLHMKAGVLTKFEAWLPLGQTAKIYQYLVTNIAGDVVSNRRGLYGSQNRRPYAFAVTLPQGSYTVDFTADKTFAGKATFMVNGAQLEQTVRVELSPK